VIRRVVALLLLAACGSEATPKTEPTPEVPVVDTCERVAGLDALAQPASYDYDYACSGEVAPAGQAPALATVPDDCSTGIWPDLDDTVDVCPTVSDVERVDPVSGLTLPSSDSRPLPTTIAVSESGTFLPPSVDDSGRTLRVVAWNIEYSRHLDEQIEALTTHPDLADADVYLLSEVDRCSTRNGVRRAARELAEALGGIYLYGIEFVELNIDRDVGGDTGQAIIARRPLTDPALTCHSSHYDWFASEDEPRLGQRVALHAEVGVAGTAVRVYVAHLESNDLAGDKRSVQSKEILDASQELACERPQIIAGDFNAPYCGAPELQVLRDAGFVDAVALAGDTEPTHQNGLRLDYIFVRGFSVLDGGVVRDLGVSDHDAIWVELELE
jgi:endonuclease/exonuclease/phosphatase family metal-dependent hydrolase